MLVTKVKVVAIFDDFNLSYFLAKSLNETCVTYFFKIFVRLNLQFPHYENYTKYRKSTFGDNGISLLTAKVPDTIPATSMWMQSLMSSSMTSLRNFSLSANISDTVFCKRPLEESAHGGLP